ncbi:MAG: gamma-glutamylcyclotransferase [Bryobacterales bacterium]|nr:gamma-glutamylcyclotransferase [Bryobacterales bacterium]
MQSSDRFLERRPATCGSEDRPLFKLFVYGTLKRGYGNHERFCRGYCGLREAQIRGRLYEGPGFPFLQVPDEDILARGTVAPSEDVATQARVARQVALWRSFPGSAHPRGRWGPVYGELLSFSDPERRLPAIDRLEGYSPGEPCLYHRVLVRVAVGADTVISWTYVAAGKVSGRRIPSGRWPQ